jgi:hypothetical protein
MPAHYLIAGGTTLRPFVDPGYTVRSYALKRFTESTTPVALAYNLLLPFLNTFNSKLEEHIKETSAGHGGEEDLAKDAALASKTAAIKFVDFACRVGAQTAVVALLLDSGSKASLSVVHAFDMYQRLHYEYYARVLERLHLPRKWASLIGAPPKAGDIEFFEKRPLSIAAAAEDCMKRQAVFFVTDMTVGTVFAVVYEQTSPDSHRPTRRVISEHLMQMLCKYGGAVVGAVAGTQIGGGSAEYFGEVIGSTLGLVLSARRLASARAKLPPVTTHLPAR